MPGNDPFRINNIVNGTYNISLSLRNDFGQSGETAPELYGECKHYACLDHGCSKCFSVIGVLNPIECL